jgi:hypothetical protein
MTRRSIRRIFTAALIVFPGFIAFTLAAADEGTANQEAMEQKFSAMLEEATLHGTWAPFRAEGLGDDLEDRYFIVRAAKEKGDRWLIVSRLNYKGQQLDVPIPVVIKFAGDAAVMILNDVPVGEGKTWSARILFHDDVYAGSWWGAEKKEGGVVSGTITRAPSKGD